MILRRVINHFKRQEWTVTGTALDVQFVHVWTVENAKVTRFQQYADTSAISGRQHSLR
jgi:ketosteroid isomerase-like protein